MAFVGLMGCKMGGNAAEQYFEDRQQLEAARAISAGDLKRLQTAVTGLELDRPGKKSLTLLWFAIHERNFDAIRFLISRGSNPEAPGVHGLGIPVEYALLNEDTRILAAMLDGGLDVNHVDAGGTSLVQKASCEFSPKIAHLRLLVERGANVNVSDSIGNTPLSAAISTNMPDRARFLLESGAKWQTYTVRGVMPAYIVDLTINRLQEGSDMRREFESLRDYMASLGAKFPADNSATVRAWMKSQGLKVAE